MEPEIEQAILDVIQFTNPGVKDPKNIPFSNLSDLRQDMEGFKPKNMDLEIDHICRQITNIKEGRGKSNQSINLNTIEVQLAIQKDYHIWFAINYLFTVLDRVKSLVSNKKKRATGMPNYQLYLQIVLNWACNVYMKKQEDPKFFENFKYAIAHGNSILAKRGTKRKNGEEETENAREGKISKLTKTLVCNDGYFANTGSVTNIENDSDTESDDSDVSDLD